MKLQHTGDLQPAKDDGWQGERKGEAARDEREQRNAGQQQRAGKQALAHADLVERAEVEQHGETGQRDAGDDAGSLGHRRFG